MSDSHGGDYENFWVTAPWSLIEYKRLRDSSCLRHRGDSAVVIFFYLHPFTLAQSKLGITRNK
jgi:hypothetical protein